MQAIFEHMSRLELLHGLVKSCPKGKVEYLACELRLSIADTLELLKQLQQMCNGLHYNFLTRNYCYDNGASGAVQVEVVLSTEDKNLANWLSEEGKHFVRKKFRFTF